MKMIPVFLVFLMSVFVGASQIEAEQLTGRDIALKMYAGIPKEPRLWLSTARDKSS